MANFAFFHSTWIITNNRVQAIGTTMVFDQGKLNGGLALKEAFLLRARDRLFHLFYAVPYPVIRTQSWLGTGCQTSRTVVGLDTRPSI
jgi:hypothetical protein